MTWPCFSKVIIIIFRIKEKWVIKKQRDFIKHSLNKDLTQNLVQVLDECFKGIYYLSQQRFQPGSLSQEPEI